jgi:hypothetical protein
MRGNAVERIVSRADALAMNPAMKLQESVAISLLRAI